VYLEGVVLLTSADSKGRVLGVEGFLVVFDLVAGNVEGQVVADEGSNGANLNGSEFPLSKSQTSSTIYVMEENILACRTPCTTVW
jgi:hypothetical protein